MGYAFISYSHDDRAFVQRAADQLRRDGVEVWSDHSLIPGDKYPELIERKIAECAVFVPVMSPSSNKSDWVAREGDLAEKYQRVVMPIGLNNLIFDRYRDVLCEMTSPEGVVSEGFRRGLREACSPSDRFTQHAAWSGHASAVRSLAFSADGSMLVSADDHAIRIWEVRGGAGRLLVAGGLGPTWPVKFIDGGRIASAATGQPGVHLWNASTGALLRCLGTHDGIKSIDFSADGMWLATGGGDQPPHVWTADSGNLLTRLSAGTMLPAWPLAFAPDGQHLAVANAGSDSISVWSADAWQRTYRISRPSRASALCWTPSSTILISGGREGDVQLDGLSQGRGQLLRQLQPHTGRVHAVACAANGRIFATAGEDATITIVGVVTGEVVQTLHDHNGPVYALAFSPDESLLASAGWDKVIRLWRTRDRR